MALSGIVNASKGALQDVGNFAASQNPFAGLLGFDRPANIADFKSNMTTPANSTHFDVSIVLPQAVQEYIRKEFPEVAIAVLDDVRGLRFQIEAAELPGRSIMTSDHKHYGPTRKIAYGSVYVDTSFTVVNRSDYQQTQIFQIWQDYIVGRHRVNGQNINHDNARQFNVNYHKNYTDGSVIINAYDSTTRVMKSVSLVEAYPLTVSPVQLNWSGDNIAKTQVTMTYRFSKDLVSYRADRTFAKALEKLNRIKRAIPKDGKPSTFLKSQATRIGQVIPGATRLT